MRRLFGWAIAIALTVAAIPWLANPSGALDRKAAHHTKSASVTSLLGLTGAVRNATPPGRHDRSLVVGGLQRYYTLVVPTGLAPTDVVPVILALHGIDQTVKNIETYSGLDQVGQQRHAVIVYPDGYKGAWNAGVCCGVPAAEAIDDVDFLASLLSTLRREFVTDARHDYIVGFSNGGMMAYRYLCDRTADIGGIGVVSGAFTSTSSDGSIRACNPSGTSRVIDIHGLRDINVPYSGGFNRELGTRLMSVPRSVPSPTLNDCQHVVDVPSGHAGVQIRDGVQCDAGAQRLVTVASLDHQWTRDVSRYGVDETQMLVDYLLGAATS